MVAPPEFEMSPVTLAVVIRLSVHVVWAFEVGVGGNKRNGVMGTVCGATSFNLAVICMIEIEIKK